MSCKQYILETTTRNFSQWQGYKRTSQMESQVVRNGIPQERTKGGPSLRVEMEIEKQSGQAKRLPIIRNSPGKSNNVCMERLKQG